MRRFIKSGVPAAALLGLLVVGRASAQVIDQSQDVVWYAFSSTWVTWNAQTFMTTAGNIAGGGFYLHNQDYQLPTSIDNPWLTISLWDGDPGLPGSSRLAGGMVSNIQSGGGYFGNEWAWADVFWSPVAVTLGHTYWLVAGNGAPGWASLWASYTPPAAPGSLYPDGTICSNDFGETGPWLCRGDGDATFRTFTDPDFQAATVPEPATITLLAGGIVAMAATRRRRPA